MKSSSLVKKIEKEIAEIEFIESNLFAYNRRNLAIRGLLKTGAFLSKSTSFLLALALSANVSFNMLAKCDMTPFRKDEYKKPISVCEVVTSTGSRNAVESYVVEYDKFSLVFSTGWKVNDVGLFEREEIHFSVNESILEKRLEEILLMSLDELKDNFILEDVITYAKSELNSDDLEYEEDMVVIERSYDDWSRASVVAETEGREILSVLLFFLCSVLGGCINVSVCKLVFKDKLKRKIARIETQYPIIGENKIDDLKEKLLLMKQNLALLTGEGEVLEEPRIMAKRKK